MFRHGITVFRCALHLVIPLALGATASGRQSRPPTNHLDRLQGEWTMVSGIADGQSMPDSMRATARRVCKGDETSVSIGGQVFLKARFSLDSSKTPGAIDYQMLEGFTKGKSQLGIYMLSNDIATFCFSSPGAERPADFSSQPGDGRTLTVWRRSQTAGTDPANGRQEPGIAGPLAPDIKPEALWDGRKVVPFKALDSPKMVAAGEADFLEDSDYILGVSANGESRAYPTRFIWWHHVINDNIGKPSSSGTKPIAVTYCSVCNTGIRYDRQLNGVSRNLDFYGLYNGVVALCDRETGSAFLQVDGRFVSGPLAGSRLEPGPVLDTTWGQWKTLHPETLVMSPDSRYAKFYSPKGKPEPRGYDHFPAPFFEPTLTLTDKRLPFFEKVLGVAVPDKSQANKDSARRAYPLSAVKDAGCAINDSLGGLAVAVFLDPETLSATAFSRVLGGKTLSFHSHETADHKRAILDKETGTQWDIEGHGQAGPLRGKTLAPLESHLSQWYGWAAYFPATTIYGRSN